MRTIQICDSTAFVLFASIASSLPHVNAGKLRALGVTGLERSPVVPDVPTLDESGLTGFNVGIWYGLLAPGRTPDSIVKRLLAVNAEIIRKANIKAE